MIIIYNLCDWRLSGQCVRRLAGAAHGQPLQRCMPIEHRRRNIIYLVPNIHLFHDRNASQPRNLMDGENRSVCRIAGAVVAVAAAAVV